MRSLIINQPLIEFDLYLTKAGAAIGGQSKQDLYVKRNGEVNSDVLSNGLSDAIYDWDEDSAVLGLYHIKIIDDGTLLSGTNNYICRVAGELQFNTLKSGTTFELGNRFFDVKIPKEIYIDGAGSDTVGDGSEGKPYATIDKAVKAKMGFDGSTYDRGGECIVMILNTLTLPNSIITYGSSGIWLNIIGSNTPSGNRGQFIAGGTSSRLMCENMSGVRIVNGQATNNFVEVLKNAVNIRYANGAAGTGYGLSCQNGKDITYVGNGNSSALSLGVRYLETLVDSYIENCGAADGAVGNTQGTSSARNLTFTKTLNYCFAWGNSSFNIMADCYSDDQENGFIKPGLSQVNERYGTDKSNISTWVDREKVVTWESTNGLPNVNAKAISESTGAADSVEANIGNLNAAITSRSSHSAADIWSVGTRTLTSFGTLVTDLAVAVWGAVTRTLTAGTKDTEIDAIKTKTDNLPTTPADEATVSAVGALVIAVKAKTDNLPASPANEVTSAAILVIIELLKDLGVNDLAWDFTSSGTKGILRIKNDNGVGDKYTIDLYKENGADKPANSTESAVRKNFLETP